MVATHKRALFRSQAKIATHELRVAIGCAHDLVPHFRLLVSARRGLDVTGRSLPANGSFPSCSPKARDRPSLSHSGLPCQAALTSSRRDPRCRSCWGRDTAM
jgi:hypothetical protein